MSSITHRYATGRWFWVILHKFTTSRHVRYITLTINFCVLNIQVGWWPEWTLKKSSPWNKCGKVYVHMHMHVYRLYIQYIYIYIFVHSYNIVISYIIYIHILCCMNTWNRIDPPHPRLLELGCFVFFTSNSLDTIDTPPCRWASCKSPQWPVQHMGAKCPNPRKSHDRSNMMQHQLWMFHCWGQRYLDKRT